MGRFVHVQDGSKIFPDVFCHLCKAYQCCHSLGIESNGKLFYPLNVIGKPSNAPHPPIPKVVMVSACRFHCISMHEDDDEFDSGKVVTRQALAEAFNKMSCDFLV